MPTLAAETGWLLGGGGKPQTGPILEKGHSGSSMAFILCSVVKICCEGNWFILNRIARRFAVNRVSVIASDGTLGALGDGLPLIEFGVNVE